MYIKPWSDEAERILRQLSYSGRASTRDMKLVRNFSKRKDVREIINHDLLDITNNRRKQKTWFIVPPDISVIPKPSERGISFHFKRFKFLE